LGLIPSTVAAVSHPLTAAASGYSTSVTNDSPTVYYRLDESGCCTAADSSGNGYSATYAGVNVTYNTSSALASDSDHAITLDGQSGGSGMLTGSDSMLPGGSSHRTVEFWFNTTYNSNQAVIGWGNNGTTTGGFDINFLGSTVDKIRLSTDWTNNYLDFQPNINIYDGNWNLFDLTFDGTNVDLYLNGQEVGTGTLPSTPNTTVPGYGLYIGNNEAPGSSFIGSMDEVAIYPTALSGSHIEGHWLAAAGASCQSAPSSAYGGAVAADSPLQYYPLSESSGTLANDYSGNCQDGAVAGAATRSSSGPSLTDSSGSVTGNLDNTPLTGTGAGLPSGSSHRTLELWEKSSTIGQTASTQCLIGYGDLASSTSDFALNSILVGSTLKLQVTTGSGNSIDYTLPYSVLDEQWHQLDVTFDGTYADLYVDGLGVGFNSFASTPNTDVPGNGFDVGNNAEPGAQFSGAIAEAAVYSTALSAKRIARHYLASGQTPPPKDQLSAAEFGAGAYNPCYKCRLEAVAGDPVNTATGDYSDTVNDLSIPGRGLNIDLTRAYDSADASTNGPFGYGWTFSYGMSISPGTSGSNQTITQENGSQVVFTDHSGTYTPPSHDLATLTYNSGSSTWTFQREGQNSYTFNTSGQLTQEQDLNDYTTTLAYSSGDLSTVTDNAGRSISFTWTGTNITSVTDSNVGGNTRTVSYGYTSGNLTAVTDVNGGITDMAYDGSHRMTLMRNPNYHSNGSLGSGPSTCSSTPTSDATNNHYNGSGQVDCQWDPAGKKTTFAYTGSPFTASGGTTTITDPVGNETLDMYQWGLRTSTTAGYGTSDAATTSFEYDPVTLAITAESDPLGNVTTFTVDTSGNVLTQTDPLGRVTTNTWNSCNEPLTTEDGNGVTTTNAYDANCNLTSTSTPLTGTAATATNCKSPSTAVAIAAVTCYAHGNGTYPGDVTSITDPDGNVTDQHFDSYGLVDEVKDPAGHVTATEHNADGWVTATYTAKAGCTWNFSPPTGCSSSYETQDSYVVPGSSPAVTNEFGEVGTVTDPLGHTGEATYDLDGNTASTTDGNGNTTDYTHDPDDRLTVTTRPDSTTITTAFNDNGTVHTQTNGASKTLLTFGYNHRNQETSVEDALGNTTTFTLDLNGDVLTTLQPVSGATCTGTKVGCITNTWDADSEIATVSYSDNSSENITNITRDDDGQVTAMTDGTGTSDWVIDSLHRLTSYMTGNGDTVGYGYTSGGNYELKNQPLSISYPNSVGTVDQTWNTDGTLATIEDWNSKTIDFGYDSDLNETTQTDPSTTNVTDTFGLNDADQITSVSDSNGSTLFGANYSRDDNGQVASDSSQAANQQDYKYTSLDQTCYAGSSTSNACGSPPANSYPYASDSADNLTTNNGATQTFNDAGGIKSSGSSSTTACNASPPTGTTSYCVDNKGNRTAAIPHSGSTTCDTWDQANRLTEVETGGATTCTSPSVLVQYGWTGNGVLASKTVSSTTTHYTDDGAGTMLQEKTGSTVTSYILGPGGIPVEQITGSTAEYLGHDQLGSIRLITDAAGSTGTATTQAFDPYGNSVSSSGSLTSPFGFAAQYLLSDSGLYLMGARMYDPLTAQFLSVDPALASTMEPYGYVAGNPLNLADPSGMTDAPPQPTCENPFAASCAPPLPPPSNTCNQTPIQPGGVYSDGNGGVWIPLDTWCDEDTHTEWVLVRDLVTGQDEARDTGIECDPETWMKPIPPPIKAPDWGIFGVVGTVVAAVVVFVGAVVTTPERQLTQSRAAVT